MSAASPTSEHLAVVHASIAGRTRFEVAGLYRSARVKQRLETALSDVTGVNRVTANSLTGRVLVLYDPAINMADIIAVIERHLDSGIRLSGKQRRSAPTDNARQNLNENLNIKQVLEKASSLLGNLPALLYSLPLFRSAPAQTGNNPNTESQDLEAWHLKNLDELLQILGTSRKQGLSDDEASQRLQRYGANSLTASAARSDLAIMLNQFNSAPVYMLGGSAVIAIITGGMIDAAVILGVVIINSVIGFVTERQAEKTISSLSDTGVRSVRAVSYTHLRAHETT